MTEYDWHTIRNNAIRDLDGEAPQAQTEQAILDHFQKRPTVVIAILQEVADQKRAGKARSGWAVAKARLDQLDNTANITVTDTQDRDQAITNAENWVRHAGAHYDRPEEITDHLFSDLGKLRQWHTKPLETRMVDLWLKHRPAGVKTEQDAAARDEAWRNRPKTVRITDVVVGKRLVDQLIQQQVDLPTIEAVLARGIPDITLRAELVDYAYDNQQDAA